MRAGRLAFSLLFLIPGSSSSAQDARSLLQAAENKFIGLTTYYVEGTRESTVVDEVQHDWHQEHFVIASAPGKRYHYDIKMPERWNIVVADGATEWTFQPWRDEYTRRPAPDLTIEAKGPDDAVRDFSARAARHYLEDASNEKIQSAEFLEEEVISLGGQRIPCYVIRATYEAAADLPAPKYPPRVTLWIDKDQKLIRKSSIIAHSTSANERLHEIELTETTYYTAVNLGGSIPDSLFSFIPPAGAKLASRLFLNNATVDLTGLSAPSLRLKTFDGRLFDTAPLKGHSVIVDFWASWCVPCVQQMETLARLTGDFSKQGAILLGINWSDDPKTALEFLSKNNYHWTNLRDVNGETANLWMLNGVPLLAIIDPTGNVAYYHVGYEQPEETAIIEVLRKINPHSRVSDVLSGQREQPGNPTEH
jgi:thiol-disulfide isomerase/thioredoxin